MRVPVRFDLGPFLRHLLSHSFGEVVLKPPQIRHVVVRLTRISARCYPIGVEDGEEALLEPDDRTDEADEACVAAVRARLELQAAQEKMRQQRGPDLPLDRVFVLAVDVLQLERLLEFLEQELDLPFSLCSAPRWSSATSRSCS